MGIWLDRRLECSRYFYWIVICIKFLIITNVTTKNENNLTNAQSEELPCL